jgi:hypothetical protein
LYKSPGPVAYIPDQTDPGKILTSYDKPLSKKKSFLDASKPLQPRHSRESIFAGTFKHYQGKKYAHGGRVTGDKIG